MSITDELREWTRTHTVNCSDNRIALVAIADRIDAELAERYVALPVDADGVPIHVGDVLDCDANGYKGTFSVFAIGDNVVVGNHPEEFCYKRPMNTFHVARFCHHHESTVEDVLTELEGMRGNGKTYEDVVMRCADLAGILRELLAGEDA